MSHDDGDGESDGDSKDKKVRCLCGPHVTLFLQKSGKRKRADEDTEDTADDEVKADESAKPSKPKKRRGGC